MNDMTLLELLQHSTIKIIDIRSSLEFSLGHIPSAINIPFHDIFLYYSSYLQKNKEYCLYCANGNSSHDLAIKLGYLGYRVKSLIGGYENYLNNQ